jgi:hypothetical protein
MFSLAHFFLRCCHTFFTSALGLLPWTSTLQEWCKSEKFWKFQILIKFKFKLNIIFSEKIWKNQEISENFRFSEKIWKKHKKKIGKFQIFRKYEKFRKNLKISDFQKKIWKSDFQKRSEKFRKNLKISDFQKKMKNIRKTWKFQIFRKKSENINKNLKILI